MKGLAIQIFSSWVLSIFVLINVYGEKIDSLKKTIVLSGDDYIKAKNLIELSNIYQEQNNYSESIKSASQALNISKWNNYKDLIIESYNNIAYTNFFYKNYSKSLENYLFGARVLKTTSNFRLLAKTYNNVALIYNHLDNPKKAILYSNLSQSVLLKLADDELLSDCYINLADAYKSLKDFDREVMFLKKAIAIRGSSANQGLGIEYNNLGAAYWNMKKYDSALEYFNKYLKVSIETNDSIGITRANNNIGSTYYSLGQYSKSLEYFNKSLKLHQENISVTYTEIVYSYCKLKDLKNATHYFELARKTNADLKELSKASDSIVALCIQKNNIREALKYQMASSKMREDLLIASKTDVASTVKAKYEVEGIEARLAEKENYLLAKENLQLQSKQKQFLIIILILTVVIAAGMVYLVRRRLVEKEKKLVFFEEGLEEIGKCLKDIKELKAEKKAFL